MNRAVSKRSQEAGVNQIKKAKMTITTYMASKCFEFYTKFLTGFFTAFLATFPSLLI